LLVKKTLFCKRSSLETLEDGDNETHFVADLIGLKVYIEKEGELFGVVEDVVNFGGGPLLEVKLCRLHSSNLQKKRNS